MSSAGSHNDRRDDREDKAGHAEIRADEPGAGLRRAGCLIAAGLAVVAALLVGVQVFSIFFAFLFPPMPPLPADSTLVEHTSAFHGSDRWQYSVQGQHACDVVDFYEQVQGARCQRTAFCERPGSEAPATISRVARCTGEQRFSIFAMRWQVDISGAGRSPSADLRLAREIYWSGVLPPEFDGFYHDELYP